MQKAHAGEVSRTGTNACFTARERGDSRFPSGIDLRGEPYFLGKVMRRIFVTACSLLLSALALVGGPAGAMLCMHEAGLHLTAGAVDAGEEGAAPCADDANDNCAQDAEHRCDGCMDVALKGLDLAQLRFGDAECAVSGPGNAGYEIASGAWSLPDAVVGGIRPDRAPPAPLHCLTVVRASVLLI